MTIRRLSTVLGLVTLLVAAPGCKITQKLPTGDVCPEGTKAAVVQTPDGFAEDRCVREDGTPHGPAHARNGLGDTQQLNYEDGKLHGQVLVTMGDGSETQTHVFDHGKSVSSTFEWEGITRHCQGECRIELTCPEGTTEQSEKKDDRGKPYEAARYCARPDGTRHGPYMQWHRQWLLAARGYYRDGLRDGAWLGTDGLYFVWFGTFTQGKQTGMWTVVDREASLEWRGPYEDGKAHGRWTWTAVQGPPAEGWLEIDHGRPGKGLLSCDLLEREDYGYFCSGPTLYTVDHTATFEGRFGYNGLTLEKYNLEFLTWDGFFDIEHL